MRRLGKWDLVAIGILLLMLFMLAAWVDGHTPVEMLS